jgi:hypothetical protein
VNPEEQARLLQHAADRAATRPAFLGWVLARYAELEKMGDDVLRQQWQVSTKDWPRLQLCLRPRAEAFLQDVTQIANEFHLDRGALAAVARRVDAVAGLHGSEQPGGPGSLLAARTRKKRKRGRSRPKEADND